MKKILFDLQLKWKKWQLDFQNIMKVYVPRWCGFHQTSNTKTKLIVFCDGSAVAYGCVAYLQYINTESIEIKCCLLLSESRLAPLKNKCIIIPKLELMTAILSIQMKEKFLRQLDIAVDKVRFYTDSQIVLHYLQNENKKHSVFITNGLNEIQLHSKFIEWNFVPRNKNPADLLCST